MARKSRKQIAVEEPVIESVSSEVFSTAIYARLSVENSGKSEKVDVMRRTGCGRRSVSLAARNGGQNPSDAGVPWKDREFQNLEGLLQGQAHPDVGGRQNGV